VTSLGASIGPYPFRLDPFLGLLGRVSAFWPAPSAISAAAFTLSRAETTSSKARRYNDRTLLCRPVFVLTCLTSVLDFFPHFGSVSIGPEACGGSVAGPLCGLNLLPPFTRHQLHAPRATGSPSCQPWRRIWMARLAKYPSIPNASKSHTTQTMFVNRTRPRPSDGIAFPSRGAGRQSVKKLSITRSPGPSAEETTNGLSGRALSHSLPLSLRRPVACWFRCCGRSRCRFPYINHDLMPPVLGRSAL
jgi:hypothetical protein